MLAPNLCYNGTTKQMDHTIVVVTAKLTVMGWHLQNAASIMYKGQHVNHTGIFGVFVVKSKEIV